MALVVPGGKLFLVGQLWKIVNELGAIGDSTGSVGGRYQVCSLFVKQHVEKNFSLLGPVSVLEGERCCRCCV